MMKRHAGLVLMLFFAFLAAGCAAFNSKPSFVDTKMFLGDTFQFERQGKAVEIMDKVQKNQEIVLNVKDGPNFERVIYSLYVKADLDSDHVISEQEAETFWRLYQKQFDAHMGVGQIKFK
ncbi:MAG: hypothetical protein Q7T37_01100 [bacterium]|nr:hypothetical protein [bacterium]MDO8742235.1 hypothetical protein [bacterium]